MSRRAAWLIAVLAGVVAGKRRRDMGSGTVCGRVLTAAATLTTQLRYCSIVICSSLFRPNPCFIAAAVSWFWNMAAIVGLLGSRFCFANLLAVAFSLTYNRLKDFSAGHFLVAALEKTRPASRSTKARTTSLPFSVCDCGILNLRDFKLAKKRCEVRHAVGENEVPFFHQFVNFGFFDELPVFHKILQLRKLR